MAVYESRAREPSLSTLAALVEATGTSIDLALGSDLGSRPERTGPIGHRLARRRTAVLALAARHGMTDLRVFGSVTRGDDRPDSDLDLLVEAIVAVRRHQDRDLSEMVWCSTRCGSASSRSARRSGM